MKTKIAAAAAGAVLVVVSTGLGAAPRLQTGPDAEITHDGLHRLDKTVMDAAWVKPDLDLRGYTKLMLVGAGFSYKAVDNEGKRYIPGRSNDTEFYITPENRARVESEMREAFLGSLEKLERYEVVTQAGPGVLMLVGGVYDVVSSVPPVNSCVGRCEVYLTEVGAATLVIELRDSMSNEILARAADRRAAESAGWPIDANSVTVWPEVRRLASSWGQRIVTALEKFDSIDDLAPTR
jgi:Protein of unknown function (DUF3313)